MKSVKNKDINIARQQIKYYRSKCGSS